MLVKLGHEGRILRIREDREQRTRARKRVPGRREKAMPETIRDGRKAG